MNHVLGKSYTFIHENYSPEAFKRAMLEDGHSGSPDIYAFVGSEDGSDLFALYKTQHNYIMTSNGNTFANVSLR